MNIKDCGKVWISDINSHVQVNGWIKSIRDHGGISFMDIRDHSGVVQVVVNDKCDIPEGVRVEAAVSITGNVVRRAENLVNPKIPTGDIEIVAFNIDVVGKCDSVPFQIGTEVNEELRLKYRYLDLREGRIRDNIILRSKLLTHIRQYMDSVYMMEFQTPILSSPSPEGARDYVVPSRKNPGKFYALPQAPQMFKQMLMVAAFPSYFQIAPCFRDEDGRADRTTGEFYQLDMEWAWKSEDEIQENIRQLIVDIFLKTGNRLTGSQFRKIPYKMAMEVYGTDKPDLRNHLVITDVTDMFEHTTFAPFVGKTVRMILLTGAQNQNKAKSFYEGVCNWALSDHGRHIGWFRNADGAVKGSLAKVLGNEISNLFDNYGVFNEYSGFIIADDNVDKLNKFCGLLRTYVNEKLEIPLDGNRFCWITDFPMYEQDDNGKWDFAHNPFSKVKSGDTMEEMVAHQYDLVCNGYELASGAIRNNDPDSLIANFKAVGYTDSEVEARFGGLLTALRHGAPPHGGAAIGIERLLMILTKSDKVRDVVLFPLNQQGDDLLLGGPFEIDKKQYDELQLVKKPTVKK